MNIYSRDKNLIIEDSEDFDIEDILECGQCFHFWKLKEREYELVAFGRYLHIRQDDSKIIMYDTKLEEYEEIWNKYFDFDTDYGAIKKNIITADDRLITAVNAKPGIRILKQDFFETLISFIISQNKQIPHIKQIVNTISDRYGDVIHVSGDKLVHVFPTVEQLYEVPVDALRECKVGFRAPYIRDAVEKVYTGEICEDELRNMSPDKAREKLMTIRGVGEKVANCVLLYGLSMANSFPVDVWMKRIMEDMYFHEDTKKDVIERFAYDIFGEYAGYAQQYLFYYGRELGIGK